MTRAIDLNSVVNIHDKPFLIIDRNFRIIALNRAYEQAYNVKQADVLGRPCFTVTHRENAPCYEHGEDCPHQRVFDEGQSECTCLHIHHDENGNTHRVRIKAFPIRDLSGELYVGELVEPLSVNRQFAHEPVHMAGQSRIFLRTLEQLKLAAFSDAPVLLEGETGTGKDLAARFIHQNSDRAEKPFLTLDCTVLNEALFEAEVFGYERGAYTGSVGEKEGLFELVDGGTLFLDEVSEMTPQLQAKFLRALETGEFRRVGGRKTLHTNARIICATNRNLAHDVDTNRFREDLYYRVACLHIAIPSLRDRLPDVPLIARALLKTIVPTTGRSHELSDGALAELQNYHYPGNIRELRNLLLSAAAACGKKYVISRQDVAEVIARFKQKRLVQAQPKSRAEPNPVISKHDGGSVGSLHDLEAHYLEQLIKEHNGSRREIARALGVSERTLYRKLKRHGLNVIDT